MFLPILKLPFINRLLRLQLALPMIFALLQEPNVLLIILFNQEFARLLALLEDPFVYGFLID